MSNSAHISIVQELYRAVARADVSAVVSACAPDVDWQLVGRREDFPTFGQWKGPAEVERFFQLVFKRNDFRDLSAREFHVSGDKVFVLGVFKQIVEKTGKEVASEWCHVFTIRDGKITAFRGFIDTAQPAGSILHTLIHELNHRLKNTAAVVQSIVVKSLRPGMSIEEVREELMGRLGAMAQAVSMLTDSGWTVVSLRALLSPGVIPFADRIDAKGPDLELQQRDGQAVALLFYELATNAAKHGALSVPDGRVRLEWELTGEGDFTVFHLRWEERGGPPAEEPKQSGFGSVLIGRIVPKMLGGKCEMRFLEAGFAYELTGPGTPFRRASNEAPAN